MSYAKSIRTKKETIREKIFYVLNRSWRLKGSIIDEVLIRCVYEQKPYAETVGRQLRHMAEDGEIKSKINKFGLVVYRLK